MSVASIAFGKKLKELRTQRGWSQQELADKAKMGIAQVHRYEKGTSQPTLDVIRRLAIEFRVSADEFLFDGRHGPAKMHIKSGRLLQRFEKIAELPEHEQEIVVYLLDAVIARAQFAHAIADTTGHTG